MDETRVDDGRSCERSLMARLTGTMLCIVGLDAAEEDARAAAALASAIGAHLSVLLLAVDLPPTIGEIPLHGWADDVRALEKSRLKAAGQVVAAICAGAGLSFDVAAQQSELAWADDDIAERCRYADLVLLGRSVLSDTALCTQSVQGTLFAAARPVMLMAGSRPPTLSPRVVLLAWDSGPQCARAAFDMRPLLAGAAEVHVTMVDPAPHWRRNGEEPGADIAASLARLGAKVVVDRLAGEGRSVAEAIRQHATDIDADVIVMGAYNRSRLRQKLLGGTTRTILDDPPVPVLMSR